MHQRRERNERGAATTELVIAAPLLLLLLMLVVQFALWEHATHVAQTAAERGARAARLQGGTAADGKDTADAFIAQNGSAVIVGPQVTVTRDATVARVLVTGRSEDVVPFLSLPISVSSQGPVETYTP